MIGVREQLELLVEGYEFPQFDTGPDGNALLAKIELDLTASMEPGSFTLKPERDPLHQRAPELHRPATSARAQADRTGDTRRRRARRDARISWDKMVQMAKEEGWYQHGPQPDPPGMGPPDGDYMIVGVAHTGLTCFVYSDKSDAEAHEFLGKLSPLAPAGYTLHEVRMRL